MDVYNIAYVVIVLADGAGLLPLALALLTRHSCQAKKKYFALIGVLEREGVRSRLETSCILGRAAKVLTTSVQTFIISAPIAAHIQVYILTISCIDGTIDQDVWSSAMAYSKRSPPAQTAQAMYQNFVVKVCLLQKVEDGLVLMCRACVTSQGFLRACPRLSSWPSQVRLTRTNSPAGASQISQTLLCTLGSSQ